MTLLPVLEDLERKSKAKFIKIDVDESPDIAGDLGVMGLPTMIVLQSGIEVDRKSGIKNRKDVESFLAKYL